MTVNSPLFMIQTEAYTKLKLVLIQRTYALLLYNYTFRCLLSSLFLSIDKIFQVRWHWHVYVHFNDDNNAIKIQITILFKEMLGDPSDRISISLLKQGSSFNKIGARAKNFLGKILLSATSRFVKHIVNDGLGG